MRLFLSCLLVAGIGQGFPQQKTSGSSGRFALRRPRIQKIRLGPISSVLSEDSLPSEDVLPTSKSSSGDLEAAASQVSSQAVSGYLSPSASQASIQAVDSYLGPASVSGPAFSSSDISSDIFSPPAPSEATALYQSPGASSSGFSSGVFGSPSETVEEVFALPAIESYGEPLEETVFSPSEPAVVTTKIVEAVEPLVVEPTVQFNSYSNQNQGGFSQQSTVVSSQRSSRPVDKIVRSQFSGPNDGNWNYNYETESGIKQEARGELRTIGDATVSVMSGSYSYIGTDGQTYVVDWYADETGYHPSAPHLPKDVPIPFPEVQAAVDQQLKFAAEEAAAASQVNSVTVGFSEASAPLGTYGSSSSSSQQVFNSFPVEDDFLQGYEREGRQASSAVVKDLAHVVLADSQPVTAVEENTSYLDELEEEVFDDFRELLRFRR